MKTTDLIKALQEQVEKHGDMEIQVEVRDCKTSGDWGAAKIEPQVVTGKNVFRLITRMHDGQKVIHSRRKYMTIA